MIPYSACQTRQASLTSYTSSQRVFEKIPCLKIPSQLVGDNDLISALPVVYLSRHSRFFDCISNSRQDFGCSSVVFLLRFDESRQGLERVRLKMQRKGQ